MININLSILVHLNLVREFFYGLGNTLFSPNLPPLQKEIYRHEFIVPAAAKTGCFMPGPEKSLF
jgi:hypothetical protein